MVNKWSTGEDILMAAVHAAMVPAHVERKIVAVSALTRHVGNYYGLLTLAEMEQQSEELQRDPNSLHFLTENHRGAVRMEVIRNMVEHSMQAPMDVASWYSLEEQAYVPAEVLCRKDLGVGCYVF